MLHVSIRRGIGLAGALALAGTTAVATARDLPQFDKVGASPKKAVRPLTKDEKALVRSGKPVQYEDRFGVPSFVWTAPSSGSEKAQRAARPRDPEAEARGHLSKLASMWNLDASDVKNAKVIQVHDIGSGPVIVKFAEEVNGVEVFRDEMNVAMGRDLDRIAVSGYLGGAKRQVGNGKPFKLGDRDAVAIAFSDRTGVPFSSGDFDLGPQKQGPYSFASYGKGQKNGLRYNITEPARVKPVYFHSPDGYEAAYYVEVEVEETRPTDGTVPESPDDAMYGYVISAADGSILFRNILTWNDAFTYRVWADTTGIKQPQDGPAGNSPTPHPDGFNSGFVPPFVAPILQTLENIQPFVPVLDVWLPASATNSTVGNNVDAYADIDGSNGRQAGDVVADLTDVAGKKFDRTYDTALNPGATLDQRKAAVIQMFYTVNHLHDWFYAAGFNEVSRNAQKSNYGRGGLENDDIRAEGQDSSGINNANMSAGADGSRPRMQQYVFTNGRLYVNSQPAPAPVLPVGIATGVILQSHLNANPSSQPGTATANLVLVNDGSTTGTLGTTTDACQTPFVNAADINGNIALIDRAAPVAAGSNGACSVITKITNAAANGAIGVVLANNNTNSGGAGSITFLPFTCATCTVPYVAVSLSFGNSLKADLANGAVNVTVDRKADLDGTIDNQIVQHEWGHYITNRLVANNAGLVNNQGGSMGEGWGDFNALLNTVREGDDLLPNNANWGGTYSMAGYTTRNISSDGWYFGIRRFAYSTDMTKDPLTFKHITNGVSIVPPSGAPCDFGCTGTNNAEVHNAGEVWSTMLWECLVALLNNHPFDDARTRMRNYLVAGLKLTPVAPTFTEARDGILAAAYAADPSDYGLLCAAFAKRGAGTRAVSPDRWSGDHAGVVESFECSPDLVFVSATLGPGTGGCDSDPYLDNYETATLTVTLKNDGSSTLTDTTAEVSSTNGTLSFASGTLNFPASDPFQTTTASVDVSMLGAVGIQDFLIDITFTDSAITFDPPEVTVNAPFRGNADDHLNARSFDDVEAIATAWTKTGAALWDRAIYDTVPPFNYAWLGADSGSTNDSQLRSPALVVTGPFSFTFDHRYSFENTFDGGVIEYATNPAGPWTDVGAANITPNTYAAAALVAGSALAGRRAFTGNSAGYPAFVTATVNLPALAPNTYYIRFRAASDGGVGAKGWEIDNITFNNISNTPFTQVVTHLDGAAGPAISNVAVSPQYLWPPNHTLRDVNVTYDVTYNCPYTCSLSAVSDEPDNGTGDGDTEGDIQDGADANHIWLRAERSGKGTGRTYTVTVSCTDGTNTNTSDIEVYVSHNITAPKAGAAFEVGKTVNFAGVFRDTPGSRHTATWSFDNLSAKANVSEPTANRAGTVRGSYTFSEAGVYSVKMNVSRRGGDSATSDAVDGADAMVVIFDPKGGYVTGGGSFDSPAGAYLADATAQGKASFGFVSKYFKNATNPKGETSFGLRTASMHFNAVNLDYLVVDGAKAIYKGFGKINGAAGYQFLLSVVDGQIAGDGVDKIRVKIWDKTSGRVVYDTQPGAGDFADPTTALAGDVITIQP